MLNAFKSRFKNDFDSSGTCGFAPKGSSSVNGGSMVTSSILHSFVSDLMIAGIPLTKRHPMLPSFIAFPETISSTSHFLTSCSGENSIS